MNRIFCIPDIHARNDLLQVLLTTLKSQHMLDLTIDKIVFTGDMIDRGPDAKLVIDTIRDLQKNHPNNIVVLKGNHEGLCLAALRRGWRDDFETWFYPGNGGGQTMDSFSRAGLTEKHNPIPDDYLDWMEGLKLFHEEPGFFFSHAPCPKEKDRGYMRGKPFTEHELVWTYFDDERGKSRHHKDKEGNDLVGVCGHIHRLNRHLYTPRYYKHYLFCDAGCGCHFKAPLVCTEVTQRIPIEIWPEGVTPIIHQKRMYIPEKPKGPNPWSDLI